jgi:hypothetical protein
MHSLPPEPAPSEITSRYLRQTNHYAPSIGRVKPRAFHPSPKDGKTSIFRVQGLTEFEIWALGDEHIDLPFGGTLLALAEVSVEQITGLGLHVESAEPPPRHANIMDWPAGKDELMSKAQELAALATLRLRAMGTTT